MPESDDAARDYLIQAGILRIPSRCTICGSSDIRLIRRNQLRCRYCRNERSLRQGSILDGLRISFPAFLTLVLFFSDNISANDASLRLGLAYNTVYEVYHRIRSAVMATEEQRFSPARDPMLIPVAGNEKQQIVFGIRIIENRIIITEVTNPDPEIISVLPVPAIQRGNILFIDAFGKTYYGFITYLSGRHGREFVRIRARNGMSWSPISGFWDFAGRTWSSHKGIDRYHLPAFVQELAFRYNNRGVDLFPLLLERIAVSYGS